jgi:hypothetical protein
MTTTPTIPGAAAPGGLDENNDDGQTTLRVGAVMSQADLDRLLSRGGITFESQALSGERTGWDGLTKKQEEEERLLHQIREQTRAEEEYDREMKEVRDRADALIAHLDEEERQCREELERVKKRPIVLPDGRVVEADANGQFTTDANGQALTDSEKAEAERQRKQKEATEQALNDKLAQIQEARARAEKARDLGSQSSANLTPAEMKERQAQAQDELARAQAVAPQQAHYETDASASSTLASTDTLAALGLGGPPPDRTTSFSASLDGKDARSAVLQNQFTGAAEGSTATPPDNQAPGGNTGPKTQIVQPNQ